MTIEKLEHATIRVHDLEDSVRFYTEVLGMTPRARWDTGAYLSLGDLWLCLSCDDSRPADDYTHIAFSVAADEIDTWRRKLTAAGAVFWKDNISEGASLYFLDPDGHKLELHAGNLTSRLASVTETHYPGLQRYPA